MRVIAFLLHDGLQNSIKLKAASKKPSQHARALDAGDPHNAVPFELTKLRFWV